MVTLTLVFDGGLKHSSYKLFYGEAKEIQDVYNLSMLEHNYRRFPDGFVETSNAGEYLTLYNAINYTTVLGYFPAQTSLVIYGDSELVRQQIGIYKNKDWVAGNKCNHAHLQSYRDKIRATLEHYKSFRYDHVGRKEIVKLLGH